MGNFESHLCEAIFRNVSSSEDRQILVFFLDCLADLFVRNDFQGWSFPSDKFFDTWNPEAVYMDVRINLFIYVK